MKTITKTPRALADEAVSAWRASQAATLEAGRAYGAATKSGSGITELGRVLAEITFAEARHAEAVAQAQATATLDQAERSEGDALAVAIDPTRIAADLPTALEAEEEAHAAYVAARTASFDRVRFVYGALEELAARRGAADLPAPQRLPAAESAAGLIAALSQPLPPTSQAHAITEHIRTLRSKETNIRADLERERLAEEKELADNRELRKARDEADERRRVTARSEHAAAEAAVESARRETEKLANAHRSRAAG